MYKIKTPDKLYLNNLDLPHLPLFEGEENLKLLSLEGNLISKIDHLVSLNSLLYLNFYNNKITEIENLQNVFKLKALMLGKNNIEKIKNLNCLVELEVLDLHSNKIKVIENLSQLKKLRLLNLANNLITSFIELGNNKNIEELNLRKNLIVTVPMFVGFDKLRKLNVGKNLISKVEYLNEFKKLKSLSELILEENPVLVIKESNDILKLLPIKNKSNKNISNLNNITTQQMNKVIISTYETQPIAESTTNSTNLKDSGNIVMVKRKLTDKLSKQNPGILSSNRDKNVTDNTINGNFKGSTQNKLSFINNVTVEKINTAQINNINNTKTSKVIENKDQTETNVQSIEQIISHIQHEWNQEIDYIIENGYNGFNVKRLKETKIFSGHAELEENKKLNIYGNAIKVIYSPNEFYQNIDTISFNFFNIDLILSKKFLERLKSYKRLKKLMFSFNNIHSYFQIIKFEDSNNIESFEIKNNEICSSVLLKYFLLYRFQHLKEFNGMEINNKDKALSKKLFEYFDNCISIKENLISKAKDENKELSKSNIDYVNLYNTNAKKKEFYNFVVDNYEDVLDEIICEELK